MNLSWKKELLRCHLQFIQPVESIFLGKESNPYFFRLTYQLSKTTMQTELLQYIRLLLRYQSVMPLFPLQPHRCFAVLEEEWPQDSARLILRWAVNWTEPMVWYWMHRQPTHYWWKWEKDWIFRLLWRLFRKKKTLRNESSRELQFLMYRVV